METHAQVLCLVWRIKTSRRSIVPDPSTMKTPSTPLQCLGLVQLIPSLVLQSSLELVLEVHVILTSLFKTLDHFSDGHAIGGSLLWNRAIRAVDHRCIGNNASKIGRGGA
ncbi:hypothetical protein VTL71DRAFT_2697 [Oculimacula yallundae]|uniref:Uncharacterized protein n=1 Tax=Oculimacula yallundae TaxID=86028 RepID=A0ABR4C9N0_9HELO